MKDLITSKYQNIHPNLSNKDNINLSIGRFKEIFQATLGKADNDILHLIGQVDKIIASSLEKTNSSTHQYHNNHPNEDKNIRADSIDQSRKSYGHNTSQNHQTNKRLKIDQLIKKKAELMTKLGEIDKALLDQKFCQNQPFDQMQLSQNKQLKAQKLVQNSSSFRKKKRNSEKDKKTLELVDLYNQQKIRRHEEIIYRMQQRQQQEMKKILELEQRRIKFSLMRNRSFKEDQNKNLLHNKILLKRLF